MVGTELTAPVDSSQAYVQTLVELLLEIGELDEFIGTFHLWDGFIKNPQPADSCLHVYRLGRRSKKIKAQAHKPHVRFRLSRHGICQNIIKIFLRDGKV